MQAELKQYVENTSKIRRLSAPRFEGLLNAAQYSEVLRENFTRIGELAQENRKILDEHLYPILKTEGRLDAEVVATLSEFCEELLDAYNLENLDPSLHYLVANRLLKSADEAGDTEEILRQLDNKIMACYTMVNQTRRIFYRPDIAEEFRAEGIDAGLRMMEWLRDREKFASLSEELRELVLINSRYFVVLCEGAAADKDHNRTNFEQLEDALTYCDDPFFQEMLPNYDWKYHNFRTLNYLLMLVEYHNERQFSPEICEKIADYADMAARVMKEEPEYVTELEAEGEFTIGILRARYEAGRISRDDYFDALLALYRKRNSGSYIRSDLFVNLLLPLEYMLSLDPEHLSEDECAQLDAFYHNIINYAFRMPNDGFLSYMLEYLSAILWNYIETPGGMTFEEMGLSCLAALHPPTHVHSRMVGQLTRSMIKALVKKRPDLFSEFPEADDPDKLIDRAFHAALCHDFGKISILDTIMVYGRNILDMEFALIKQHPSMGAEMLLRNASTAKYAPEARGHHKWYDNSVGYPPEFDVTASPDRVLINVLAVADCLDAATDTVGRSYNRGKTLEEFVDEIKEQSDTRYAPYMIELLSDPAVLTELEFLLRVGRKNNYTNTYLLLRMVQEKSDR